MIATGNPLAAIAAQRILCAGGSAVDAAIAADAVLGVVEPMATGIGGDLLAMLVQPDGSVSAYNGTGRAPLALSVEDVRRLPGNKIPERHPLSVTTPGVVCGWHDLHARYGRHDWSALFTDAIGLAKNGFDVAPIAAREWALFDSVLRADPNCAELYRAGNSPNAGERFANPGLARVLASVAADGYRSFYSGSVPRLASAAVQKLGGVLDAVDFEEHRGNFCDAIFTEFCGSRVYQCPPNTHGVAILDALNEYGGSRQDPASPESVIRLVNAAASALQRARETVTDPSGTVCTVIVDADGLAITLMSSVFKRFGSGIVVPGAGFVLQNRGFGFSVPGQVNGAAPGKRPYHTVVPGAVTKNGKFFLGLGVVGGLMQPQGQLQILTRILAAYEKPSVAVQAPRWRLEHGHALAIEKGMPEEIETALRAEGFAPPARGVGELAGRSDFGGAQIVMRTGDGRLQGVSDQRKDGVALGS